MNALLNNSVVSMNNLGVQLMSMGDYTKASAAFGTALKQVKPILDHAGEESPRLTPEESHRPYAIHSSVRTPFEDSSSRFGIFTECFVLSTIEEDQAFQAVPDLLAAVILYNVGLAFHLRAKATSSAKGLRRASHFYEFSAQLCQQQHHVEPHAFNSSDRDVYVSLVMALANNTAAIALEVYDTRTFERQRAVMYDMMMDTDVPEFFCSNYVSTMSVLDQPAPAA